MLNESQRESVQVAGQAACEERKMDRWRTLWEAEGEKRMPMVALVGYLCLLILLQWYGPDSWPIILVCGLLAAALALSGALWLEGKVRLLLNNSWFVAAFHVMIAFVAAVPAREFVSRALQSPAQDFDLAVALMTGVLYVPMWGMVSGASVVVTAILVWLYAYLLGVLSATVFDGPVRILVDETRFRNRYRGWVKGVHEHSLRYGVRSAGALFVALLFCFCSAAAFDFIKNQSRLVRLATFFADFQDPGLYPCLLQGKNGNDRRVRLLENGVVSVATRNGFDVEIKMHVLDLERCKLNPRQ